MFCRLQGPNIPDEDPQLSSHLICHPLLFSDTDNPSVEMIDKAFSDMGCCIKKQNLYKTLETLCKGYFLSYYFAELIFILFCTLNSKFIDIVSVKRYILNNLYF